MAARLEVLSSASRGPPTALAAHIFGAIWTLHIGEAIVAMVVHCEWCSGSEAVPYLTLDDFTVGRA